MWFPGQSEIKIPPLLDLDSRVTIDNAIEEASPMPTEDGFDLTHPLPQFPADQDQQGIENAPDEGVATSRVSKASILIAAGTATGIAVLAMGNPVALLAEVSAALVGNSSPQSTPVIQSAADAPVPSDAVTRALPLTTGDAPTRDENIASEPAAKDQAQRSEPPSEALFMQFQAWAAEQDAQARGGPVQPGQNPLANVEKDVPAPAAENVQTPHRLVQKRRQIRGRPQRTGRGTHAKPPKTNRGNAKRTRTTSARARCPRTGSVRAKSPRAVVLAEFRPAQLDLVLATTNMTVS
jgi:hypothetical protein